jgi:hypothetical protein
MAADLLIEQQPGRQAATLPPPELHRRRLRADHHDPKQSTRMWAMCPSLAGHAPQPNPKPARDQQRTPHHRATDSPRPRTHARR